MYFFSSTRTTCRYLSFAVSATLLQLIKLIDCSNKLTLPRGTKFVGYYQKHPIVCDGWYRSKYFPPELQNGRYTDFGPAVGFPQAIESKPPHFDYGDSEFLPVSDTPDEFLLHKNDQSTEFMNYYDAAPAFRTNFNKNSYGKFMCNVTDTIVYDFEDDAESRRRLLSGAGDKKVGKIKKYKTPKSMSKKKASLRHRKSGIRKFNIENHIFSKFYTMEDTFSSMFNGRRHSSKNFRTNLRQAGWNEDSCKSLRRIVGGYVVESAEELPYMVFVDTGCGGGIIGNNWVLTAGHCVDEADPRYVHTGSIHLMAGCQYTVIHVYVHPRFTRECLQYDIALLKISPSFMFSPAIKPILMSKTKVRRKSCGIVAGWGANIYKGPPRYKLTMAMIPVVARKKCRMFRIKPGQFCAGYQDATSDACQGDSGGPFVINGMIAGVVSYGYKCATPRTPGVYVDISYHRKWIRNISGI